MSKRRVVITGIGIVSPIGIGRDEFWKNLFEGKACFGPITLFDTKDLKVKIGGEITDFDPKKILGEKGLIDLDRSTLLLLCAAKLALDEIELKADESDSCRMGVVVGTTFGSFGSIFEFNRESLIEGPRYVNPSIFPNIVVNSPASRISIRFKIKGFNATVSTGMCAGLDAIEYAWSSVNFGRAEQVVVGSVESLSFPIFLGFHRLGYLSGLRASLDEPISCPFDRRRDGVILSEGATALIIQDAESAEEAKLPIYGEILGVGSFFDPSKFYRYNPEGKGMKEAMKQALENAQLSYQDIDCIFANANSTKEADLFETKAIKEIFGKFAYKIPITAIKSILGETLSAWGGFAIAAALGALKEGVIPPIINYKERDKDCDLSYVFNQLCKKSLSRIMINAFDPNGFNTSLIIGKYKSN
jgi:3-oxoacyl-[acyl-carrier-protein] synthase II